MNSQLKYFDEIQIGRDLKQFDKQKSNSEHTLFDEEETHWTTKHPIEFTFEV
jgi:hypothetical protein